MPVLQGAHAGLSGLPAPRLSTIRRLAQRCGVGDGALRTALSRACAAGSLQAVNGRYRLGPQSLEEAAAARALGSRIPGYVLAAVAEGEAVDLPALRDLFARLGLRPFQRSLWIGARTTQDRLSTALQRAGLAGQVTVFQADEVDPGARERLCRLWGLEARAETLRAFQAELTAYLAEPGISPSEAAWRCVQAAPVWYRIAVQDEPPFPLDLLGPDYPLHALNAAWRDRLAALSEDLTALWTEEAV